MPITQSNSDEQSTQSGHWFLNEHRSSRALSDRVEWVVTLNFLTFSHNHFCKWMFRELYRPFLSCRYTSDIVPWTIRWLPTLILLNTRWEGSYPLFHFRVAYHQQSLQDRCVALSSAVSRQKILAKRLANISRAPWCISTRDNIRDVCATL